MRKLFEEIHFNQSQPGLATSRSDSGHFPCGTTIDGYRRGGTGSRRASSSSPPCRRGAGARESFTRKDRGQSVDSPRQRRRETQTQQESSDKRRIGTRGGGGQAGRLIVTLVTCMLGADEEVFEKEERDSLSDLSRKKRKIDIGQTRRERNQTRSSPRWRTTKRRLQKAIERSVHTCTDQAFDAPLSSTLTSPRAD